MEESTKVSTNKMEFTWELYGFGYDDSSNQYKVVKGKGCSDGFVFSVYSSLTDSWRKIKGLFPYKQTRMCWKNGTLLNGAVHWLVERDQCRVIMSFHLAEEEVREIQVRPTWRTGPVELELGIFRDQLCISAVSSERGETYKAFWVMKEYGVRVWTKSDTTSYNFLVFGQNLYDLVVVDGRVPLMCNFVDKNFWVLQIDRHTFGSIGVYVQSRKPLIDEEQKEKSEDD